MGNECCAEDRDAVVSAATIPEENTMDGDEPASPGTPSISGPVEVAGETIAVTSDDETGGPALVTARQAKDGETGGSPVPPVGDAVSDGSLVLVVPGLSAEAAEGVANLGEGAQWRYTAVPDEDSVPDRHEEYATQALPGVGGLTLLGARVRGKKHKHEGTNCDDWFELATVGDWNLAAVADGAGSRMFSRVGAAESCRAAIESLRQDLGGHRVGPRPWTGDTFHRNADLEFVEGDLRVISSALVNAMQAAQKAVEVALESRANSLKHYKVLGNRDVTVNDLAATLLIVVQTVVADEAGTRFDLIMSCAVGDGMIAAIDKDGRSRLLMTPDSGQYSGETEFLSAKLATTTQLRGRINVVFGGQQRAVLAMTDGVSDDYFPNDRGMSRLYGDLSLNGVLSNGRVEDAALADALARTLLPRPEDVSAARFDVLGERLTADGMVRPTLLSVDAFAKLLGLPLEDVFASPALLAAGHRYATAESLGPEPAEKLLRWLDSYHVRGSFDDRTLVAMFREIHP